MICPYCAEDVPAGSQQHYGCRRIKDKPFPPFYLDYHGAEGSAEPLSRPVDDPEDPEFVEPASHAVPAPEDAGQ